MLERCRNCGFEHADRSEVEFRRNHVHNKILPYCKKCGRRLYNAEVRNLVRKGRDAECTVKSASCATKKLFV